MISAFVLYWKIKNNHSEITFCLQHLLLHTWYVYRGMTSIAQLHTATWLMKFYYLSCAISHEKESNMHFILQFGADLAIQSLFCVIELCSEFSGFFIS